MAKVSTTVTLSWLSLAEVEASTTCSWCGGQAGYRISAPDGSRVLLSCSSHIAHTAERVAGRHS